MIIYSTDTPFQLDVYVKRITFLIVVCTAVVRFLLFPNCSLDLAIDGAWKKWRSIVHHHARSTFKVFALSLFIRIMSESPLIARSLISSNRRSRTKYSLTAMEATLARHVIRFLIQNATFRAQNGRKSPSSACARYIYCGK